MRIHPEGIEVLKWFGFAALLLFLFVLRFSDVVPSIYLALLERSSTKFPAKKRKRGKTFKLPYRTKVRQKIAFWILSGAVLLFLVAEWFFVREAQRIDRPLLLPMACTIYAAGLIVIGLGPQLDEHGSKWRRWPFWVTVVATGFSVFGIALLLDPETPRAVFAVLMLSLLPFAWIVSFMNYVEERIFESEELGVTKGYDGTKPLNLPSHR